MINGVFKKIKRQLFSLRVGFIVVFLFAVALGVGVFFAGTFVASHYIEEVYVAEENKKEREDGYLRDLQAFINDNKISSAETGAIPPKSDRTRTAAIRAATALLKNLFFIPSFLSFNLIILYTTHIISL